MLWKYTQFKKHAHAATAAMNWELPFVRRCVDAICRQEAIGRHPHFVWTVVHHITPGETQYQNQKVKYIIGKGVIIGGVEALYSDCNDVIYTERHNEEDKRQVEIVKCKICDIVKGLLYSTYLWSRGWVIVFRCTSVFSSAK